MKFGDTAKIIRQVDDFRLLELECHLPSAPSAVCYEIVFGRHYWAGDHMEVDWVILRVILHEDIAYAKKTALDIFNNLIKSY